ncbi:hypothetical protein TCCBUS3UF1_16720 [Thermus sp. CCB_US3_UF1]|nr:hypothetical protein TCCBUS3UF1_16720 [Thermus sp. CCB_US3_UF1]
MQVKRPLPFSSPVHGTSLPKAIIHPPPRGFASGSLLSPPNTPRWYQKAELEEPCPKPPSPFPRALAPGSPPGREPGIFRPGTRY